MWVVKPVLTIAVLAGLAVAWNNLDGVVAAYERQGRSSAEIRLTGVDLTFRAAPLGPSPYVAPRLPSSGVEAGPAGPPAVLAFVPREPAEPEPPLPVELRGGAARIGGVVSGPDGPVGGATVLVERHTTTGSATTRVVTGADGRWSLQRLLGGRYRIRAWVPGWMGMERSEVRFVANGERVDLPISLVAVDTEPKVAVVGAGDIFLGLTGSVAVTLTTTTVDEEGRIVVAGVGGVPIDLTIDQRVTAASTTAVTDDDGVARFVLRCEELGRPTAAVGFDDRIEPVTLPSCVAVPPPPPPSPEPAPEPEVPGGTDPTLPPTGGSGEDTSRNGRAEDTSGDGSSDAEEAGQPGSSATEGSGRVGSDGTEADAVDPAGSGSWWPSIGGLPIVELALLVAER